MPTARFPCDLATGRDVRRFVEEELGPEAVGEETLFRVQLLATELVTNAVRHARSPVELTVAPSQDRIRIEARDDSRSMPCPPPVEAQTRHRGLLMMEDLSEGWGVEVHEHNGKVVWCEVPRA